MTHKNGRQSSRRRSVEKEEKPAGVEHTANGTAKAEQSIEEAATNMLLLLSKPAGQGNQQTATFDREAGKSDLFLLL